MVPVFIGSLLLDPIKRSQYTFVDYFKVAVVTAGVIMFNFGKTNDFIMAPPFMVPLAGKGGKAAKPDDPWGLTLIAISLTLDGVTVCANAEL
jgi:hypothetical protein